MNSYNPYNPSTEYNNTPPDVRIGDNSSGDAKNIGQNLGARNASNISESHSHGTNDMNSSKKIHELTPEKASLFKREEQTQKPAEIEPDFYPLTKDDTIVYNESEYIETIKSEQENLEVLLKDLYTGSSKKDVLSDQKMNEPYLLEFFQKYPQSKTDFLAIMLGGLYLALDDIENANTKLARIRDPDLTEDDNNNAGYHRAYYMIMASLKTEEKNFKKARELLKQSWNIPQRFFAADKENFLDFYSTIMGRIHLKEGNLKEAEECFKDALAQRLLSKNSRLISSSYNDLALLYIENRSGISSTKGDDKKALQYLNKAREYDRVFQQELDSKKYDVLLGQVDYKRPDITQTEEAYKKLQKP